MTNTLEQKINRPCNNALFSVCVQLRCKTHTQVKQNTSDYSRQKISRPPGCLYAVCNSSAKQNALEYPRQEIRRPPRLPIKTTRYICTSEKRKTSEYLRRTIYNSCPSRPPSEQKTLHRRFSTKNQQKQKKDASISNEYVHRRLDLLTEKPQNANRA